MYCVIFANIVLNLKLLIVLLSWLVNSLIKILE